MADQNQIQWDAQPDTTALQQQQQAQPQAPPVAAQPRPVARPAPQPQPVPSAQPKSNIQWDAKPDVSQLPGGKSIGDQLKGAYDEYARGTTEGVVDTLYHLGTLLNPVTHAIHEVSGGYVPDNSSHSYIPLKGMLEKTPAEIEAISPNNTISSKVGKVTEGIGEWMVGGELADMSKLLSSAKGLSFLAEHPMIAKMVESSLKNAAVGGAQAAVHGQNVAHGAEGGAVGGAIAPPLTAGITAAGRGVGSVLANTGDVFGSDALKTVGGWLGGRVVPPAENVVEDAITKQAGKVNIKPGEPGGTDAARQNYLDNAQEQFHQVIRDSAQQAASDALPPDTASAEYNAKNAEYQTYADAYSRAANGQTPPVAGGGSADVLNAVNGKGAPVPSVAPTAAPQAAAPATYDSIMAAHDTAPIQAGIDDTLANGKFMPEKPVPPPSAAMENYEQPEGMRDQYGQAARTVLQSAKADFQALDEASGGRFQRFDDQIKNVADKMGDATDDEEYDKWATQRDTLEQARDKVMQDMVAKGEVDPATAERASANFKRAMALQDVNKAVQLSTERVAKFGEPVTERVNPVKLSQRLQKLNDIPINGGDSRLVQALGEDGAQKLIDNTDWTAALQTVPQSGPSGQLALKQLLRDNTITSPGIVNRNATKTNWEGVLRDLEKMSPEQQHDTFEGEDLARVRGFIQNRVRAQKTSEFMKGLAKYSPLPLGVGGVYTLYRNLTSDDSNR